MGPERAASLTYEDLFEMFPEEDLVRRELIHGELFVTPSPTYRHQQVVARLLVLLAGQAKEHGGEALAGPFDIKLSERDVVEPDVLFFREETRARIEQRFSPVAPDLVVEVSSPSTRSRDLRQKRDLYEQHGASEYWFVDLESDRVEVYRLLKSRFARPTLLEREQALESPVLPGFSVRVEEILGPLEA
jgi:Uma2 family endonuclease